MHHEGATAGPHATLALHFTADDVYLVMSGEGSVGVTIDGRPLADGAGGRDPEALHASSRVPTLQTGVLTLTLPPGVEAYDFTFG